MRPSRGSVRPSSELNMPTRAEIIRIAREYIATPFVHQGRIKGVGIDCANFIANVATESGATPDVEFEKEYRRREDGTVMAALLGDYLEPVSSLAEALPGDVVAFHDGRDASKPRHLGFISATERYLKAIHASERGVVEHRLDLSWQKRVHSVWRIRGLND